MDGGEKEKLVALELKDVVKRTSRRKGVSRIDTSSITLAPKPTDISVKEFSPSLKTDLQITEDYFMLDSPPRGQSESYISNTSAELNSLPVPQSDGTDDSAQNVEDAIFLMHFIDTVFSLQFPTYSPDVIDGGRGWLLVILLRSKPFYHAALAISSYHRRMIVLAETNQQFQIAAMSQQENHLGASLSLINHQAEDYSTIDLGIAMCNVQFVFYEVIAELNAQCLPLTTVSSSSMGMLMHGSHIFTRQ